jgi:hypothetical protein
LVFYQNIKELRSKPQWIATIKSSGLFSLLVNETADVNDDEQFIALVLHSGLTDVEEEFLHCQPLLITTKGEGK